MIVRQAMAIADIGHLAKRDFATLSGGEQQRVRFARALAQLHAGRTVEGDQILILDEPVASLDLKHQVFLLDAARDLARAGVAVMVVLHDLTLARAYADEIVVVSDGRIAARGSADAVLHAPLITRVFGLAKERQHTLLPWMG
jgi:iron complex transport system ATP-binding protein